MTEFQNIMKCSSCGKAHPRSWKFCPHCGMKVPDAISDEIATVELTQCINCRAKLVPEAVYCSECGLAVDQMDPYNTTGTEDKPAQEELSDEIDEFPGSSYTVLNFLSTLLWIIGIFIILLGITAGFVIANNLEFDGFLNFLIIAATGLGASAIAIGFFALAEFIRLFISIEENQGLQIMALDEITRILKK